MRLGMMLSLMRKLTQKAMASQREYWDAVVNENPCRAYPSLVGPYPEISVRFFTFEAFAPARYHRRDTVSDDRVSMTRIASHNETSHRFQAPRFRARLRMSD